jgi:hypothetical protein
MRYSPEQQDGALADFRNAFAIYPGMKCQFDPQLSRAAGGSGGQRMRAKTRGHRVRQAGSGRAVRRSTVTIQSQFKYCQPGRFCVTVCPAMRVTGLSIANSNDNRYVHIPKSEAVAFTVLGIRDGPVNSL